MAYLNFPELLHSFHYNPNVFDFYDLRVKFLLEVLHRYDHKLHFSFISIFQSCSVFKGKFSAFVNQALL